MRGFEPLDFSSYEEYQIHRDKLERTKILNSKLFAIWNTYTGFFQENTGYWYEMESLLEDAVQLGYEAGVGLLHKPDDYDIDETILEPYKGKCDFCKHQYFVYGCEEECARKTKNIPCKLEMKEYLE